MIKKVLIVDDNSTNLYMLETMLKGNGFEVISAENGKDALDKARLNPPDMIITDILMPVMDGFTLCRHWKSDDSLKHIPLVFYTATYTEPKDEAFASSLGADRFILKPQEPDIFMNILKEVLGKKYVARQVVTKPLGEEMEFFRQHNEILFKKLEKKMLDLEIVNQNLKLLEEQHRLSLEHIMDVIYSIDADLNVSGVSPSVETILGYKPQDFIGRPVSDLGNILTPESFQQAIADISLVLKGETISATVYRFIAKDGTIKYGEVSGSPIMRNGKIMGVISVARDITDRKLAEEALLEREKSLASIYNTVGDAIFHLAVEPAGQFRFVSVNSAFLKTTRLSSEMVVGRTVNEVIPEPSLTMVLGKYRQAIAENTIVRWEEISDYPSGRLIGIVSIAPVFNDKGICTHLVGSVQDITDRKQAEGALRESEEKYRNILEGMDDIYFEVDIKGNITFVNSSSCRMSRYSKEELIGMSFKKISVSDSIELVSQYFGEIFLTGKTGKPFLWNLVKKNGEHGFSELVASLIRDKQGKPIGFRGIGRDITERKLKDEIILQSEKRFRTLYQESPIPMFTWQKKRDDFFLIDCNTAATLLTKGKAKIFMGKSAHELYRKRPEIINDMLQCFKEQSIISREIVSQDFAPGKFLSVYYSYIAPDLVITHAQDVTEVKQAVEALQKSEENFHLSLDNSPLGVRISTIEAKTLYANKAILDIYGYDSIEEMDKTPLEERYTPQSYAEFETRKEERKQGELGPSEYEISIVRKNGEIRNLQVFRKEVIWNGAKQFQVIYKDITERRQAEEKLRETLENLQKAIKTTIQVLGMAAEAKDPYTAGHQKRVADLAGAIAMEMGLPDDKIEGLKMAGSIHDIGKISIPAEILSKPTKLTSTEYSIIKEHSQIGYNMLKDVESPWSLAQIVHQHHERINGSGYPSNLKGDEILLEARILAVADVVEAMGSHRPYRPTLGIEAALEEIEKNKGILYDAVVADACLKLFRENGYQLK